VLLVPAEQLVSAVSPERNCAVLPDKSTNKKGRNHRGVIHRFVKLPRQEVQDFWAGISGL
jgi:hypothetical protein